MKQILCINAGGIGDLHGLRARRLTHSLEADVHFFDVDRGQSRLQNGKAIWALLKDRRWDLVYQESTGIAGGANLIRAAKAWSQRYVISTGDPVGGFFRTTQGPVTGAVFERYERSLYRHCAGFIGWTPYLTGMALKMGARRAVTVEGAADLDVFKPVGRDERDAIRRSFGIEPGFLVCGVVGSLKWNERQRYCYGLELVEMMRYVRRPDVRVLIVGDGDGRAVLEERIDPGLRSRIHFTGRLSEQDVVRALNAMDVGFITQTLDGLGSYRLTTKLPEYLAAGLPVAMSPVPGFYDYAYEAGWALPPHHPASSTFHRACAAWVDRLEWTDVEQKAALARPLATRHFSYDIVGARFRAFIDELLTSA